MSLRGDHPAGGGGLHLVPAPQAGRERLRMRRRRLTLAGAPYRPGELPVAVALGLPAEVTATANASAAAHCLPVELILRAGIDAAHAVGFLADQTARSRTVIVELLDTAAEHCGDTVTAEGELLEYSRLLRRGESASLTQLGADGRAELLLPLELALAWRLDAAREERELGRWATGLLRSAPAGAIGWEAAAASSGRRLGEWAYACALSRSSITIDSASPQSRTKPIGL